MQIIEKIGFVFHLEEIFNHYHNILKLLPKDSFDLILLDFFSEEKFLGFRNRLISEGYPIVFLREILEKPAKYRFLVTNHFISGSQAEPSDDCSKQYLPLRLGMHNVRFMYGLGFDQWHFADWNRIYDVILCFGPYQKQKLNFCHKTFLFEIGYPRYDDYFHSDFSKEDLLRRFNGDTAKKTIVWLPSLGKISSIDHFAPSVSLLSSAYNLIIKPHPISLYKEVQRVSFLKQFPATAIIEELIDNTLLFFIADIIIADYGGSCFSALYLDKNLLLLDVPNAAEHEEIGSGSADFLIRESILHIGVSQADQLTQIISNEHHWTEQKQKRQHLRKLFFAPFYGYSAKIAAFLLEQLEELITKANLRKSFGTPAD